MRRHEHSACGQPAYFVKFEECETGHREHENEKRLHQSSQSWRQTGSHLLIIHLLVQGRVAAEQAARRISVELNERKKRADGLKVSEKRWQEILDSMPVCRLRPMMAAVRTTDCGHICRLIRAARFPSVPLLVSISL